MVGKTLIYYAFLLFLVVPVLSTTYIISDCSILNQSGATYILNQSIIDSSISKCINIQAENITLDCQGYTIDGDDTADIGVYIGYTQATIRNCTITDWRFAGISAETPDALTFENLNLSSNGRGIYLYGSTSNILVNVTANSNSHYGLSLVAGSSAIVRNSTFKNNGDFDVHIMSSSFQEFTNVTGTDNKPIVYYNTPVTIQDRNDISEIILGSGADNSILINITINRTGTIHNNGILLDSVNYVNITDIHLVNTYGLYLYNSKYNTIKNAELVSNKKGIYLYYSSHNTFKNITNTYSGIFLEHSDNNNLTKITSNFGEHGIYLRYSKFTNLTEAVVANNEYGIRLYESDSNIILDSVVMACQRYGMLFEYSGSNYISNVLINSSRVGLDMYHSSSNTVTSSRFINNEVCDISLTFAESNLIYNNFFNSSTYVCFEDSASNIWNTTKQKGVRIYSNGDYIGGNFWAKPDGTGYSETCVDINGDGFCDHAYDVRNSAEGCSSNNCDYLPLSTKYGIIVSLGGGKVLYSRPPFLLKCGNGICDLDEDPKTCPIDCLAWFTVTPQTINAYLSKGECKIYTVNLTWQYSKKPESTLIKNPNPKFAIEPKSDQVFVFTKVAPNIYKATVPIKVCIPEHQLLKVELPYYLGTDTIQFKVFSEREYLKEVKVNTYEIRKYDLTWIAILILITIITLVFVISPLANR